MVFRPATPGFIVTLAATILLALVSFGVPIIKSVYFLQASLTVGDQQGTITIGTLGYCIQLDGETTCTKPSVGYQFDINKLLGNNIKFAQIPEVVVKWITYALILHIVALALAAVSAIFGLLAHVREMAMTCFSSCISGFAATIALFAFIFDLVLFFLARARINTIQGASASIGIGIWLTLSAWVLLFFSGCFYGFGRCCISSRPRGPRQKDHGWTVSGTQGSSNNFAEQMRLDAVKAEADRKNRQKQGEIGLPAFYEQEVTKPLTSSGVPQFLEEEDDVIGVPYRDHHAVGAGTAAAGYARGGGSRPQREYRGGYAQAPAGSRAVDEYYSPTRQPSANAYPPQPSHYEPSITSTRPSTRSASQYTSSAYTSPPPHNQYLSTAGQTGHGQYPSAQDFGHTAGGTTYHSANSQYPTNYGHSDPYATPQQNYAQHDAFVPHQPLDLDTYNSSSVMAVLANPHISTSAQYPITTSSPQPQQVESYASDNAAYYTTHTQPPERSYTLGGGGYGANIVPDTQPDGHNAYYPRSDVRADYEQHYSNPHSPAPINTNVAAMPGTMSPRGPRELHQQPSPVYDHQQPTLDMDDMPPVYDAGTSGHSSGIWPVEKH